MAESLIMSLGLEKGSFLLELSLFIIGAG